MRKQHDATIGWCLAVAGIIVEVSPSLLLQPIRDAGMARFVPVLYATFSRDVMIPDRESAH